MGVKGADRRKGEMHQHGLQLSPFSEGAMERIEGKKLEDNPFRMGTCDRESWKAGWLDQDMIESMHR